MRAGWVLPVEGELRWETSEMLKSAALTWLLEQSILNPGGRLTWEPGSLWKGEAPCCSARTDRFLFACPGFPPPSTARNPHPTGDAPSARDSKPPRGALPPPQKPSTASADARLPPWERYQHTLKRLLVPTQPTILHWVFKKHHWVCNLKEWLWIPQV